MCRRKPATVRSGLFLLTKETYLRKVQDHFRDLMKKASPAARVLSGGPFSSTFCAFQRVADKAEHGKEDDQRQRRPEETAVRRLLLVARVGVVRSRANRVHTRTPDRVAANVPAVAGALFHKRSALNIDAVVEKNAIVRSSRSVSRCTMWSVSRCTVTPRGSRIPYHFYDEVWL